MNVISATAPAKLNLYLHVTGKNQEQYHLLDSLAVFVDVHDVIEVTAAPTVTLTIKGEYNSNLSTDDNIITKAAFLLQKQFNIATGAAITLHKHLPVAAGIGGGSADAAATLKLLLRLWKINATEKELLSIALALGADVPACLQSTSLYMSGIGEVISKAPKLPKLHIVLVNPGKPLLTKNVFGQFKGNFSDAVIKPKQFASKDELLTFLKNTRNDLQSSAIGLMPEIGTIIHTMTAQKECMLARMSGSGATCFGLFTKRGHAENFAVELSKLYPNWWIRAADLL